MQDETELKRRRLVDEPQRKRTLVPPARGDSRRDEAFRCLTWNVLADTLAGKDAELGMFDHPDREELSKWLDFDSHRGPLLWEEITRHAPHVVALQEADRYDDFFRERFERMGWKTAFAMKPGVKNPQFPDGVVLAYDATRFDALDDEPWRLRLGETNNQVALGWTLRDRLTSSRVLFVTTHLKAGRDPRMEEIRAEELEMLVAHLRKTTKSPFILMGDFNASPQTQHYRHEGTTSRGEKETSAEGSVVVVPPLTYERASALGLRSAIRELRGGNELTFSTWKRRVGGREYKHTIDYVFYSGEEEIKPVRYLELRDEDAVAFPNGAYPSDHFALCVDFEYSEKKRT